MANKEKRGKKNVTVEITWEDEISRNLFDYSKYIQFLQEFKHKKDVPSTRRLLSIMKSKIGVPTEIWKDWIKLEKGLQDSDKNAKIKRILDLYDEDVNFYEEYLEYIESVDNDVVTSVLELKTDTSFDSDVLAKEWKKSELERIVGITEFHFTDGHKIWNKMFENKKAEIQASILKFNIQNTMIENVHQMLLSRLSVPHQKLEDTFSLYSMFITKYMLESYESIMVEVNSLKAATLKKIEYRENYERKVITSNNSYQQPPEDRYLKWIGYIRMVEQSEEIHENVYGISETITLVERMVVDQYANPKAWSYYIGQFVKNKKEKEDILFALNKASRNCYWSGEIQGLKMMLDVDNATDSYQYAVENKQIYYSAAETSTFLVSRMSVCKNFFLENKMTEEELRTECVNCQKTMSKRFFKTPDPEFKVEQYFSFIEMFILDNAENSKKVWESSVKIYKYSTQFWLSYAKFMKTYFSNESSKKVFGEAMSMILKAIKGSNNVYYEQMYLESGLIFSNYLSMEYETGSSSDILETIMEIEQFKSKIGNAVFYKLLESNNDLDHNIGHGLDQTFKPEIVENFVREEGTKNLKRGIDDVIKSNEDMIIENGDEKIVKVSDLENCFGKYGVIKSARILGKSGERGIEGQVAFEVAESVIEVLLLSNTVVEGIKSSNKRGILEIELADLKKREGGKKTLLIRNIQSGVSEFGLEVFFKRFGRVENVLYGKDHGSSKDLRYAYVTMESEETAKRGKEELESMNDTTLYEDIKIEYFGQSVLENIDLFEFKQENSVYVSNINYGTTFGSLVKFFEGYLKTDFFIVDMNVGGKGYKGQAVVYFGDKNTMEEAVGLHDLELDSRKLCIKPASTMTNFAVPCKSEREKEEKDVDGEKGDKCTVRVTGFSGDTNVERIEKMIVEIVKVKRVHRNKARNKIFVDVGGEEDGKKLEKELTGKEVDGRKLWASVVRNEKREEKMPFIVPRRVQKRRVGERENKGVVVGEPKSNADFKRLYSGK
ncbi:hypothetical protein BB558_003506 [Smittium angustum]|uniref:RRM domain-containing protein n=1 Tax=Smittium angustum TaxID=133377 RepID=A0A2U1J5V6_SMIAN|nr:hypothetical protein BB558_003506 [Smittium angustum]